MLTMNNVHVEIFMVYKFLWSINFCGFRGMPLIRTKIYASQKLIPSILNNDCTYHATMATKTNTSQLFLPIKNMKN